MTVFYGSGDYSYVDEYKYGVLSTHGVSNVNDTEYLNRVFYDVNGEVRYCTLLTDTYYYYFPGQGWSSSWDSFIERDAPAGYENIDETYFTANKPPLICDKADEADIIHNYDGGVITVEPTCINTGVKIYTCQNDENHIRTESIEVDEDAHSWENGVCVHCSENCEHSHGDFDELCDVCGEEDAFVTVGVDETNSVYIRKDNHKKVVKFIPEETGKYTIFSDNGEANDVDPWVAIYSFKDEAWIAENDDFEGAYNFLCIFTAEAGVTYYIKLGAYSDACTYNYTIERYIDIVHQPNLKEPYVGLGWNGEATYQWYKNIDDEGILLDGETEATIQNPVIGQSYYCVATLADGTVLQSEKFLYTYTITRQPTNDEPSVAVNDGTDATYQWYTLEEVRIEITDENAEGVGSDGHSKSSYNGETGWHGHAHDEVFYLGYSSYYEYFEIYLEAGQTVEIIPDKDIDILGIWIDGPWNYDERMSVRNVVTNTPTRFTAAADGYYTAFSFDGYDSNVKVYIVTQAVAIDGATEPSYTPSEKGFHACKVTFKDGTSEMSNSFEKHFYAEEWSKNDTHHWHECTCGDKGSYNEHSFGEWSIIKEATAKESGEKERSCVCGEKETETIPALGEPVKPDKKKGCGSSITGGTLGGLTLLGSAAVVFLKKRKEN